MCMQVEEGGIPNEHGTWHFGRNGWCDGQNVRPWVVDVTRTWSLLRAMLKMLWSTWACLRDMILTQRLSLAIS